MKSLEVDVYLYHLHVIEYNTVGKHGSRDVLVVQAFSLLETAHYLSWRCQ